MLARFNGNLKTNFITRREFLWLSSLSAAGFMAGCAANPVTGKSQLMLVSEESEIQTDKKYAPHQFSADYGTLQDKELSRYIQQVGKKMVAATHRPHMPYSFVGVNATYVNAYAFPGGSIAATRGILLELENEAELASLLGHELGHVNARHSSQQMSKGQLTQAVAGVAAAYAGSRSSALGDLTSTLGMIATGALLSYYSRDNEREADALGMEYMVKTGYGPDGFVGLMGMLKSLSKHKPSSTELLFATHPWSGERYQTALESAGGKYRYAKKKPLYRERYMDHTAKLRSIKGAIAELQKGEKEMAQKKYSDAEGHFKKALQQAPRDYTALIMMAKCRLQQGKHSEAKRYAEQAKRVYPQEAQAHFLAGIVKLQEKEFEPAYNDFGRYDNLLPGNPSILFYKGYALEGMQRIKSSAPHYQRFLQVVNQGPQAQHAYKRLVEWGYYRKR